MRPRKRGCTLTMKAKKPTRSVTFSQLIFNVTWMNDKILNVSTMEYGKCVKCIAGTFEGGWRYAQKW
ncbi:hypothetical protein JW988_02825 [Candidatus Bathyarchaeota archaeon]|nr:hypothetical protein [Candidatus Bathyarchaeota archaeon]